jgi:uncharacterized membrane protein YgcG
MAQQQQNQQQQQQQQAQHSSAPPPAAAVVDAAFLPFVRTDRFGEGGWHVPLLARLRLALLAATLLPLRLAAALTCVVAYYATCRAASLIPHERASRRVVCALGKLWSRACLLCLGFVSIRWTRLDAARGGAAGGGGGAAGGPSQRRSGACGAAGGARGAGMRVAALCVARAQLCGPRARADARLPGCLSCVRCRAGASCARVCPARPARACVLRPLRAQSRS